MYTNTFHNSRSTIRAAWGLLESILQLCRYNSFAERKNKQCGATKYLSIEWMWIQQLNCKPVCVSLWGRMMGGKWDGKRQDTTPLPPQSFHPALIRYLLPNWRSLVSSGGDTHLAPVPCFHH